jgi:3-oxoacyl-[acyl-carrier-protein] synthase III
MRWNDIYVAGVGSELPPSMSTEDAVAQGLLTAERRAELGYEAVLVSPDLAGPDLAIRAGKAAVARSGIDPAEFGVVLHGTTWFQGRAMWAVASYVAARTVSMQVPGYEIGQRCNGGVGSLELAISHVAGGARGSAALITTGDRFSPPAVDRFNGHGRIMWGDGGTAVAVAKGHGFARVLSTVTKADNLFEGMARGTQPLDACPPDPSGPVDLTTTYKEFSVGRDIGEVYTRLFGTLHAARDQALEEAGVKLSDVKRVCDAATRGGISAEDYAKTFGFGPTQSTWDFGRRTGHLGGGDQFAAFSNLLDTGELAPGDLVMLFGGGAGLTCTAAVLEMVATP